MSRNLTSFVAWAGRNPAVFFLAYAIFMATDLIIFREHCLINGADVMEFPIPYFKELAHLIKSYGFINWFPHWGGGMPVTSYPPALWWRPDHLPYFVLSPFWVYTLQFILSKFTAGWGAFKYFQTVDGHQPLVCLAAGLLFAGYNFFIPDAISVAGIPLFLYCFDRWILNNSPWKRLLFMGGCLFYISCANFILVQPFIALFHFSLCWLFVRSKRYPLKAFAYFLGIWILYALIQLPIVLNLLVEYSLGMRSRIVAIAPIESTIIEMFSLGNIFITSVILLNLIDLLKRREISLYHLWFLAAIPIMYLWQFSAYYISMFEKVQCRISWIIPFWVVCLFSLHLQRYLSENQNHQKELIL